jgi:anti-sigma factor RsiW
MNCAYCEERMSDYLENQLSSSERAFFAAHLAGCALCREQMSDLQAVMKWARAFPVYEAPPWLPSRIVARTPRIQRETWLDTLSAVARWVLAPRTALALFTSAMVLGWMGSLIGVAPNLVAVVRDPASVYFEAGDLVNRAYDQAVRGFYTAPLVTEIQSGIERLKEIS